MFRNDRGSKDLSAVIVYVAGLCGKAYLEDPTRILTRLENCPLSDVAHPLVRNGGYERWFWLNWRAVRGRVYRKYCRSCKVSFTLLPLAVVAHRCYPRDFMAAWLWAAITGTPCRSRDFLVAQDVPVPERDERSWSDQQDDESIQPCHQTLARWRTQFADRAAALLPTLTALSLALQVDLKAAADGVAHLHAVPERLHHLVTALGLVWAQRALPTLACSPTLEECVPELLQYLVSRPLPPSHPVCRASGGRRQYDSLVT